MRQILLALGGLMLCACVPRGTVALVTAQKVEVPVCASPPPPPQIPEKPDLPVDHLREDMEAPEVIMAYRQTVVLLEGWGESLHALLKGYQNPEPAVLEVGSFQEPQPSEALQSEATAQPTP